MFYKYNLKFLICQEIILLKFAKSTSNFKVLEDSFGSVQKLFGRETDVLVLQQDKISYVLAGKNLLSDLTSSLIIFSWVI